MNLSLNPTDTRPTADATPWTQALMRVTAKPEAELHQRQGSWRWATQGFAPSGAEANEGAVKLARKFGALHRGGADRIITFRHSFHGRTPAMMAASGKPGFDTLFSPRMPGFIHTS